MKLKRILAVVLTAALLCTGSVTASAHHGKSHHRRQSSCCSVAVSRETAPVSENLTGSENRSTPKSVSPLHSCPYCGAVCPFYEESCRNCGAGNPDFCPSAPTGAQTRAAWHNKAHYHSNLFCYRRNPCEASRK